MKEAVEKFMRENWLDYLADQQITLWDDTDPEELRWYVSRECVDEYLEHAEDNGEVVQLHMIIWKLIDWKKLTSEAIEIAKIKKAGG